MPRPKWPLSLLLHRNSSDEEVELLHRWGLNVLEEASRMPTDEGIVKQAAVSFKKKTNTAKVNNRRLQMTPTIKNVLEEASRIPTDEGISKQVAKSFKKKTNTAVVNNRRLQMTLTIIEHIFRIPNDPLPQPCTGEQISLYLNENPEKKQKIKDGGQDEFPHMQLYKARYVWQYMYQVTVAGSQAPPKPLAITLARELEDIAGSSGTEKRLLEAPVEALGPKRPKLFMKPLVPPVTNLVPVSKPQIFVDILDSLVSGVLAIQTEWNTIVNGISQMMEVASRAPKVYKQDLDREKQFIAKLLKEKIEMELKLKMKDQLVQVQEKQLLSIEDQLMKTKQQLKDMKFQLLHAQKANVMMQEKNQQLGRKLESRQAQLDLKEEQLQRAWRHKELIEQSILSKLHTDLEDKAETFTQALVNEALVSHLGDLENKSEDDENEEDDDDKEDEDNEEPAGTSSQMPTRVDSMPLRPMMGARAFAKWDIDFVGPRQPPAYKTQAQYIIVAIDYLTKWAKANATSEHSDARTTAAFV
ncbi:hypothetical protein L7F22_001026 [Adiantum nelumboides]|nr:hypothetical protein [Adiantum nelumboides]